MTEEELLSEFQRIVGNAARERREITEREMEQLHSINRVFEFEDEGAGARSERQSGGRTR